MHLACKLGCAQGDEPKGTNANLRFSAGSCGFLRFPAKNQRFTAKICVSQMLCFLGKGENLQKSAKICVLTRFVPLGSSPEARTEQGFTEQILIGMAQVFLLSKRCCFKIDRWPFLGVGRKCLENGYLSGGRCMDSRCSVTVVIFAFVCWEARPQRTIWRGRREP